MEKIKSKPPPKKGYTDKLRKLNLNNEALVVPIKLRKNFDVFIAKLRKENMRFTTKKQNDKLLIYKTK